MQKAYRHRESVTSCMSLLDAVATVVDSATDGYSLRLWLDVHCLLIVEYFDRTRSRVVVTLVTLTCPSMKVDRHVFLNGGQWLVSSNQCISPAIFGGFWHSRHSLLENCQINDDLLSVRLGWGSCIRQTVAPPNSKTASPNGTGINKACASRSNNYLY